VTSKPKRISVAVGLDHIALSFLEISQIRGEPEASPP
jgi:hypothetical protein